MSKKAIIIGAGPAGLTAAYELLKRTDIVPVIVEKSGDIGGISKTVNYKGNRIDIGGHRFFSKSDRVMHWWLNILPVEQIIAEDVTLTYHNQSKSITPEQIAGRHELDQSVEKVMLVRRRMSRIYFLRRFFTYPIQLSIDTLRKLGVGTTGGIIFSYIRARLLPRRPEKSLEDFFINRFGNKLYRLFFMDYTEKVWGMPCSAISAEWGAQRIKGISVGKALAHATRSLWVKKEKRIDNIAQKDTETSLIEKFLYPKFGPGQLWEEVARQVQEMGGVILMRQEVRGIRIESGKVIGIDALDKQTGETQTMEGDYFFSTMPVQELIAGMGDSAPANVREIAKGLQYRDFITVGILLRKMSLGDKLDEKEQQWILPDTWIYIQERDVKVGRLQIFNNWSPYMVRDPNTVWIGMEYFANATDAFWVQEDEVIRAQAISELEKIGLARAEDVLDSTVLRMEKAYPAYFGTFGRFGEIRIFLEAITNLFPVGRNGMHKYNNSDHSMLTAMAAVDNIIAGITEKENLWSINTEQEYHEEKSRSVEPKHVRKAFKQGFRGYLLEDRWNRAFLGVACTLIVVQFAIFKYFYPQAGFINYDSYIYLTTAYHNLAVNTYPVGYSNFLRLFSVFTYSDTAVVAFQYLLLEFAGLFLVFTLCYFYRPVPWVKAVSLLFILLNPVWLYLANYISSDGLFIGISLLWFAILIWLLENSTTKMLMLQVGLLFVLFAIRYNALYYPLITAVALLFTRQKWHWKIGGIAASFLVIGLFIWHTSNSYQRETGVRIFSPFSGWQLANNAMYAYRYVDSADRKRVPKKFKNIDNYVRQYFDTTRDLRKYPQEALVANTFYMWDPRSPLRVYMNDQFKMDSLRPYSVKPWASVAPLYEEYGSWLIKNYPKEFWTNYLRPNLLNYYSPNPEFLNTYNMGRDTVAEMARVWFHYKGRRVRLRASDLNVKMLDFYPVFAGCLNIIFLLSGLSFALLGGFKSSQKISRIFLLTASLWLVNFGFSVFASPVVLRFQLFPVTASFIFSLFLLEYLIKSAFASKSLASEPNRTPSVEKPVKMA